MEQIIKWLRKNGYKTPDNDYYKVIAGWKSWYEGNVKNFHNYSIFNGKKEVKKQRKTLQMAKSVCESMANLLMNEKVRICLDDTRTQEFIDDVFKKNNFRVKMNEFQELKSAVGTVAYVPYADDIIYDKSSGALSEGDIKINFVEAENIYPLSWHNGVIDECAFAINHTVGDKDYVHLQIHTHAKSGYVTENKFFKIGHGSMSEISAVDITEFKSIANRIETKSHRKTFVIDRLAVANNFYTGSPFGVSLYANAISILQGIDLAYDSLCNEFTLGRKRIFVRPEMLSFDSEVSGFDSNTTEFYMLPEDNGDGDLIKEVNMELRVDNHREAIQTNLDLLSGKIGFGKGYYSYSKDRAGAVTATQVVSENSELFRTIKKHEIILEDVIKELVGLISDIGVRYLGKTVDFETNISIDFDDSIIEDKQAEFNRDLMLVNAGAMGVDELRARYMNESIEEARKNLPGQEVSQEESDEE